MSLADNIGSVITAIGQKIKGVQTLVDANAQAIANLATAQGSFGTTTPQIITTSETILTFETIIPSTDTGIMAINDVSDTTSYIKDASYNFRTDMIFAPQIITTSGTFLTFGTIIPSTDTGIMAINDVRGTISYIKDASYNFRTDMIFDVGTAQARTVTIRGRNVADNSLVYSRTVDINQANNTQKEVSSNTLLTIGKNGFPSAPLNIYFTIQADGAGITMHQFESVITSSNVVGATSATNVLPTTTKTADYTATINDYTIRADCSANNVSITLPSATNTGLTLCVKRIDNSAFTCNVIGIIDGNTNISIPTRYMSIQLQANGTSWDIL